MATTGQIICKSGFYWIVFIYFLSASAKSFVVICFDLRCLILDTDSPAGPEEDDHTAANDGTSYLPDKVCKCIFLTNTPALNALNRHTRWSQCL